MSFNIITADQAASYIKDGDSVGFSGFTPCGAPKVITKAIARKAIAEHEAGKEFKIGMFTGASTGDPVDGELARAHAVSFRYPYQANKDLRKEINGGGAKYADMHLSEMAQQMRYGFFGDLDVAILEVADITEDGELLLTTGVGIAPTIANMAKKILIEKNSNHPKFIKGLHDLYEPLDPPYRREIPIYKPSDRIGTTTLKVDPSKILGIVETKGHDANRPFSEPDEKSKAIGNNIVKFLVKDIKAGRIPKEFLPVQSGVGNVANVVIGELASNPHIPPFQMYTEVIQNAVIEKMRSGDISFASGCSLTVSNEVMEGIYKDWDFFKDKLVLRPSEISNNPEVARRLGLITINTAIEADIYGNVNSTHISGTRLMNGIGGSCDFTRNAYISIYTCPSIAKDGDISTIVPMVSHLDQSEHSVKVIVTEQGIADLRGKNPEERAKLIIENCAHPDYKQLLWDYLACSKKGHISHNLAKAFNMHIALAETGSMKNTKF